MAYQETGSPRPGETPQQGEVPINAPIALKEQSEQEFIDLANHVVQEYGAKSVSTFYRTVRDGRGKEILGTVSQRGSETEIGLESNTEHMFVNICDANKLPLYIVGEHHEYKSPKANGEESHIEPKHIALLDPLDDTREYEQGEEGQPGLPAPLWTAAFIYSLEGKPISGVIASLKERYMYVSTNGKNYRKDLETGEEKEIRPSERTSIKDRKFCFATYLGDPKYALSFYKNFSGVLEALRDANNDAVIQPHTGSFIHGPMAEGLVDAYLMDSEPISERLPGWGFAEIAGFKAWEVNPEDGSFKEVKHDLKHFKDNPDAYRKGRMLKYLVTRSDQVRKEIIALIVSDHKKNREVEIFRASQAQPPAA